MADNDTIITEMPVDEAWRQLGSAALGHIAFVIDGAPEIFPINYAVDGHTVLLRTARERSCSASRSTPGRDRDGAV